MEGLVEIIKNIGWPHVALVFAVIFIIVFRSQIGSFISRIRSVGKEGLKADELPEAQHEEARKKVVEELMNVGDTQLLNEVEAAIKDNLKDRGLEHEGDTISVLVRHLAATQIAYAFEQAYNSLFGSQITLLKQLHQLAGDGATQEHIDKYFGRVQTAHSDVFETWDVEKYLRYLFSIGFVTIQNDRYHITVKGTEFLVWLARYAHSEDKAL